jgi:hypothetical protein
LYQVAVTFRDIRGEESGTGQAAQIAVPEGGGIALSNVPQPLDADVNIVRVYLSPANGDMLYFVRDMPVGMTSATLGAGARGKPLDSQFMEKMPAGSIVRALNGRMFVARGAEMLWSEALGFGLHHLRSHSLAPIYHWSAIDDRCCVTAREPLVMHERTEPSAIREDHIDP